MTNEASRVFVTGASGFIGRRLCRLLVDSGYSVTSLVRKRPSEAQSLAGVHYIEGDVTRPETLEIDGAGPCAFIAHLVGIIAEDRSRGQTFQRVHVEGTKNLLRATAETRRERFLYLSASGANLTSASEYSRTKAEVETLIRESGQAYTIFRPSLVIGPGGEFVSQMEGLIKKPPLSPIPLPFVPIPGSGKNRFQPVYVGDLVDCLVRSLKEPAATGQTFEIGGADQVTFDELIAGFQRCLGTNKPLWHVPMPLMLAAASVLEALLPRPPITVDQLLSLRLDNVCDNEAARRVFSVEPLGFEEALSRVYA